MENQDQKNNSNFLSFENVFKSKKSIVVKINSRTILCLPIEKVKELLDKPKKEEKKGA